VEKKQRSPAETERFNKQAKRRSEVSTLFVGFLIALAIAEAVAPMREALTTNKLTWQSLILFAVFMLTTIRFFFGFQLHLMDDKLVESNGLVWLFDFIVIVVETIILTFMGELSTVEKNAGATWDFMRLLELLLFADIMWALLQELLSFYFASWKRRVLWGWGLSGLVLLALFAVVRCLAGDFYTDYALWSLLVINLAAFITDVILIDHYDLV
jgi:hypothetical protein